MAKKSLSAIERLPVFFVLAIVAIQYILLIFFWSLPGLQIDIESTSRDVLLHRQTLAGSVFFHLLLFMFLFSFYRTCVIDPGGIPDTDEWKVAPDPLKIHERDDDGQLRFCKYEKKYSTINEPDRSHYCRQLQRNLLRMDHYCPWVANGIGFRNYKYFFLCIFYGLLCLITSTWFMASFFLREWKNSEVSWGILYFNFMGAFLGGYMSCILLPFFIFHMYLTAKNQTTIEFCEPVGKKNQLKNYDLNNILYNYATVFGLNPHVWLWPIDGPIGDGLTFHRSSDFEKTTRKTSMLYNFFF